MESWVRIPVHTYLPYLPALYLEVVHTPTPCIKGGAVERGNYEVVTPRRGIRVACWHSRDLKHLDSVTSSQLTHSQLLLRT